MCSIRRAYLYSNSSCTVLTFDCGTLSVCRVSRRISNPCYATFRRTEYEDAGSFRDEVSRGVEYRSGGVAGNNPSRFRSDQARCS